GPRLRDSPLFHERLPRGVHCAELRGTADAVEWLRDRRRVRQLYEAVPGCRTRGEGAREAARLPGSSLTGFLNDEPFSEFTNVARGTSATAPGSCEAAVHRAEGERP